MADCVDSGKQFREQAFPNVAPLTEDAHWREVDPRGTKQGSTVTVRTCVESKRDGLVGPFCLAATSVTTIGACSRRPGHSGRTAANDRAKF